MVFVLFLILLVAWQLGIVTPDMMTAYFPLVLLLAAVVLIVQVLQGRDVGS